MNFIDLHQDLAGAQLHPLLAAQTDFAQLEEAGAKVVVATGFALPEENLAEVVARDLGFYSLQCAKNPNWRMIKTAQDMQGVLLDPQARSILFHIEGLPGFAGDWQALDRWYEQGLRSVGLVWNDDNQLGGGTNSLNGLTGLGREFVSWCEDRSILIDLSHANPVMFTDCIAAITKPPYISHGGLSSLVPNKRNFTDEQLKEVAGRGGIVGIFLAKSAMSKTKEELYAIADIAQHTKAAVDLLGEDAVAVGTDFGGILSGTPEGLSSVADIGSLWIALKKEGLTDAQVEKIAYKNAQKYLCGNLPS